MSVTILRKVSVSGGTVLRAANNLGDVTDPAAAFANIKQAATESESGAVQLATTTKALAGTDDVDAMTAKKVREAIDAARAALASSAYLQSDGATTARRIETQYGTVGAIAGSDWTLVDLVIDVPTSNISTPTFLWTWHDQNTGGTSNRANTLRCNLGTTGALSVTQFGAAATDYRDLNYAGWRAAYSGRRVRLTFAFTGDSTTPPVIYQDGVDITSSFTASTNGTPPNWVHASTTTTYFLQGYTAPVGYFRPGRPVNRKYEQADVDFVQSTCRLPFQDANGGSMVAVYASNFAAGVDSWTGNAGVTLTGNVDSISGVDDVLQAAGTGGSFYLQRDITDLRIGARYEIEFDYLADVGAASGTVYWGGPNSSGGAGVFESGSQVVADGTWQTARIVYTLTRGSLNPLIAWFAASSGTTVLAALENGKNVYVKNIAYKKLGALSDLIIQPTGCKFLGDATANAIPSTLVGFTAVTDRKDWQVPVRVDTSSAANKQLLGAAFFDDPTVQWIDSIEVVNTGTPTSSFGDGTTATRYTASTAQSAGRARIALSSTPFPADSAKTGIYENVTVTGGASELRIIRGHRR